MTVCYLVEKRQDSELSFNEINARLIVEKFDKRPINLLSHVLFLLQLEDMLIKLK
jgi:hypothetical protein